MADTIKLSGKEIAHGAWIEGVQSPEFKTLIDAKRRSIVPMIVIYVVGYMGLSVLAGFAPGLLGKKVLGPVNLGFVLIALQLRYGLGARCCLCACIRQQSRPSHQDLRR